MAAPHGWVRGRRLSQRRAPALSGTVRPWPLARCGPAPTALGRRCLWAPVDGPGMPSSPPSGQQPPSEAPDQARRTPLGGAAVGGEPSCRDQAARGWRPAGDQSGGWGLQCGPRPPRSCWPQAARPLGRGCAVLGETQGHRPGSARQEWGPVSSRKSSPGAAVSSWVRWVSSTARRPLVDGALFTPLRGDAGYCGLGKSSNSSAVARGWGPGAGAIARTHSPTSRSRGRGSGCLLLPPECPPHAHRTHAFHTQERGAGELGPTPGPAVVTGRRVPASPSAECQGRHPVSGLCLPACLLLVPPEAPGAPDTPVLSPAHAGLRLEPPPSPPADGSSQH